MALLKFLRRPGTATDAASAGGATATGVAGSSAALAVQAARDQARRRLLGAVVLLGIGIIGFPLVFQTQPRPLPVDIPIDIPNREQAPPLGSAGSAATQGAGGATSTPVAKVPPSSAAAAVQQPPVEPASPPSATAVVAATPSPPAPVEVEVLPPSKGDRAKDSGKDADKDRGRFIVQAGSYTDLDTVREVRQKLERMGIKTYTQAAVIEGVTRVRVRVGPFSSRQEAQEVQAKIKAAGVAASLLQL